jgi:hypothetical protein
MNGVRIGLATIVLGLFGMSVGMRDLSADDPCGATGYSLQPPGMQCGGGCKTGEECLSVPGAVPGNPPISTYTCMCVSADVKYGPKDCAFMLFVHDGNVTPACVPKRCPSDCGLPTFSTALMKWGCKCAN